MCARSSAIFLLSNNGADLWLLLTVTSVPLGHPGQDFLHCQKAGKEIEKAQYLNFDVADMESRQRTKKGFKLMAVYVTSFLVVWLPTSVVLLLEAFCPDCLGDTLSLVLLSLGITTAATLPLVFSAASKLNRASVKKTLSMMRKQKERQMA